MATAVRLAASIPADNRDMLEQFPELYSTLRHIARRERRRNPSDTMNTTVVVNEAWLKLKHSSMQWQDEQHYLATAALAMRQLLVDYARRSAATKRTRVDDCPLFNNDCELNKTSSSILALDQALQQLEQLEPRLTRLVELRFFAGLTLPESARCLGISPRTANREWSKARAFIQTAMQS
ncbi:MAG: ECF-type sigma factor [Wenzhouxiangellaceae bacterium]